jgi:putative sterol carrier protein
MELNPVTIEKRRLIRKIFEKMVVLINREMNIEEFKDTYFPNEDRTLELNIKGIEDLDTGFVFRDGRVRTIKKLTDKPTVIVSMNEDTFIRLATKQETLGEAFFYSHMEMEGKDYFRDFKLFDRMFTKYGHVLDKLKNGG